MGKKVHKFAKQMLDAGMPMKAVSEMDKHGKPPVSGSAWLMEIYDNYHPKEPKRIATMEYPSKEAEKIKKKIDKGGTQYTYKLVY